MRIHTRCRSAKLAVLCGGMVALAACTNAVPPELGTRPLSSAADTVMTEAEIADSQANTAYEAIQLSHPLYLRSRIELAPLTNREVDHYQRWTRVEPAWRNRRFPEVYLNGLPLSGIAELRGIPASSVREIRFVRADDAGAFGIGRPGGVILVTTKTWR
jgi:hypothetical protein